MNFPDSCLNLHQQYQHRSNQGDIIPTSEFNHQIISTVLKNIFKTDRLSSFMLVKFSFKMHSQLFQKDNLFSWLSFWFIKICSSLFAPMGAERRWFTVFPVNQCLLCWAPIAPIALKNMVYTLFTRAVELYVTKDYTRLTDIVFYCSNDVITCYVC